MGPRWSIAALALWLAAPAPSALQERPAPARRLQAGCTLELPGGGQLEIRYATLPYPGERLRAMRRDPVFREAQNRLLPIELQGELKTDRALLLGGHRIEPGTHRIGLQMNGAGAWDFVVLRDTQFHALALEWSTENPFFPWIAFVLTPAAQGDFTLIAQWGREHGSVEGRKAAAEAADKIPR